MFNGLTLDFAIHNINTALRYVPCAFALIPGIGILYLTQAGQVLESYKPWVKGSTLQQAVM